MSTPNTPAMARALMATLALASGTASAADGYSVRSLNAPHPEFVASGNAVKINIMAASTTAALRSTLRLNGANVTSALQPDGTTGSLTGTVRGLQVGENVFELFDSKASTVPRDRLVVTVAYNVPNPSAACAALNGLTLPGSTVAIPSGQATLTASLVPAVPESITGGIWTAAIPEFCKVFGRVAPIDPAAPPVNFQVNLPTAWNKKALQVGGGGLNGSIPGQMNNQRNSPEAQAANLPGPLSRGYMQGGSDGGHTTEVNWSLNREAQINLAYASLKKTHDFSIALANLYYGAAPRYYYFAGSSKGGQEALNMAQKFQDDYDGVFSQVPILGMTGIVLNPTMLAQKQVAPGTWLPRAKGPVITAEILRQCDALDGIVDTLVNDYAACNAIFTDPAPGATPWAAIRCPSGTDEGANCLSDAQITTLNSVYSMIDFGFPLAFGAPGFAGWGVSGSNPPLENSQPNPATYTGGIGSVYWRGAITGNPTFPSLTFDPLTYKNEVLFQSELIDATNPDLSRFFARGGKLILKTNTSDYTANGRELMRYYEQMKARLGAAVVNQGVRYYVAPGQNHSMLNNPVQRAPNGDEIPSQWDPLGTLDAWVSGGKLPPDAPVLSQMPNVPPFIVSSTRPMCRYPLVAAYVGGGRKLAGSYACRPSGTAVPH